MLKQLIHFALATSILIVPLFVVAQQQRSVGEAITLAQNNLFSQQSADGAIGSADTSDWAAMALAAAASNDSRFSTLKTYVTSQASRVDKNSATELERTILAITAVGVSPYNVQNRNLVDELKALANGRQIGSPNLLNDDIFAILAFRSAGQDPTIEPFKSVIEFVKRNQLPSGGFNDRVGGQEADIDITAVAAVALTPYTSIGNAKNFLASAQNSDGGFPSRVGSSSNVSSTAWTIWAIGINQRASEYLISQQQPNGSFGSILTTSYGLHALSGRSLPVAVVSPPVQPVTESASQQQPAPTSQQVPQQPARVEQPQPTPAAIVQPSPTPKAAATQPPTKTKKPDVEPVTTPGVVKGVTSGKRPVTQAQKNQKQIKQIEKPRAAPMASPNQNANLLVITSTTYPKETLAQTSFETKIVEPPQLIPPKPKIGLRSAMTDILAIGTITSVSILALILSWRAVSSSPTGLIQPRSALS
ncbi:MAG: prenyltransferase/squalene oxidase repeat-containing protein [Patescibacteria group bacterium]